MRQVKIAIEENTPALAQVFLADRIQAFHWCDPSSFHLSDFLAETEGELVCLAEDKKY